MKENMSNKKIPTLESQGKCQNRVYFSKSSISIESLLCLYNFFLAKIKGKN